MLTSLRRNSAFSFAERETETPRFLVERKGEGTAVTVEMRLLDRLAADPLAQKIFLELFEVLNNERQSRDGQGKEAAVGVHLDPGASFRSRRS